MNNETTQEKKPLRIIDKFFISIGCSIPSFIIWFYSTGIIRFDGNWNHTIHNLAFLFITILIILIILTKKKFKIVFIILVIPIILILYVNARYYKYYGTEIETKNHLHSKYGFKIEEMEIIDIDEYSYGLFESTPRSATIKYKENLITVSYWKEWEDDYEEIIEYKEPKEKIFNNFKYLIDCYEDETDFKIIMDPIYNDNNFYSYIIYLNNYEAGRVESIIEILDKYIASAHEVPISYSLYITKDEDLFEELSNFDVSTLKQDDLDKATQINEILNEMGYNFTVITHTKGFDKDIFVNNGNSKDEEYQNIKDENIIFQYRGEELKVYNINKK